MMNNNLLMSMMLFFSLIHLPIFLMVILYKIKIFRGKNSKQRLIFEFFLMALIYFLNSTLLPLLPGYIYGVGAYISYFQQDYEVESFR